MPIYEYQCTKCSNQYEKREGFDAPAKQKCPSCGGKAQRVIHAPPIVFKGSGFYKTDSRGAPPSESESSGGGDDTKSSGGDASSNGDKPSKGSDASSSKDTEPAAASSD